MPTLQIRGSPSVGIKRRGSLGDPRRVGCVFESVLVADRGEIARRIIRTVRRMGLRAAAVYSDADADLPFARAVVETGLVWIGPAPEAIVRMCWKPVPAWIRRGR